MRSGVFAEYKKLLGSGGLNPVIDSRAGYGGAIGDRIAGLLALNAWFVLIADAGDENCMTFMHGDFFFFSFYPPFRNVSSTGRDSGPPLAAMRDSAGGLAPRRFFFLVVCHPP